MCGIFAYFGPQTNPLEIVIKGLKKLEYRGYDSWGVALKTNNDFLIHKEVGKIGDFSFSDLQKIFPISNSQLPIIKIAIGHSRWATHGGVTEYNAHPHWSKNKEVVLCHNGIFENYLKIKEKLIKKGYTFRSETDTEVLAHLVEEYMHESNFENAVKKALSEIEGRYAVILISKHEDKLIAARRGSPLIIGKNGHDGEYFIASDIPAFLEYTNKVQYLDDDEMVIIDVSGARFENMRTHEKVNKRIVEIEWKVEEAEKGEYPHFMIKEIMEQKNTLYRAINQSAEKIHEVAKAIKSARGTFFVGCGTAGKVCMTAEYLFSKIAKRHINVIFGSEFKFHQDFLTDKSLLISVSQSGETADSLEAIEVIKKLGGRVVSILNNEASTMARLSDIVLPNKAGPEKAVASTKATTAQLAICTLLAYAMVDKLDEGEKLLIKTASQINDMLNPRYEDHIYKLSEKIKSAENIYIIGRGLNYPMALESAIKLQEVSYIHAQGFAGGELKHGPIALISENTPCIALVANDESKSEILSNAMEVKSRGGYIIGISPENAEVFDYWIKVPDCGNCSPIVNIIPVQILAYQLAVMRENNPDMPRNLAKSVTVK
ncbi:hypothetical protein A2335_03590 [Candidatus Peregrinibacteria bacterium RIFOXYB2_FULL_32_7]|nr:MAG: hypothetical protein A2335_03590 [Candidatus Peregrinibacteria bacterium RIFOXYB2_FULL_32_7]